MRKAAVMLGDTGLLCHTHAKCLLSNVHVMMRGTSHWASSQNVGKILCDTKSSCLPASFRSVSVLIVTWFVYVNLLLFLNQRTTQDLVAETVAVLQARCVSQSVCLSVSVSPCQTVTLHFINMQHQNNTIFVLILFRFIRKKQVHFEITAALLCVTLSDLLQCVTVW